MEGFLLRIIIIIMLITLSAIFSGTETAIFSFSRSSIVYFGLKDVRNAKVIESFFKNPLKLMGTVFLGNEIVNVFITSFITYIFSVVFGEKYSLYAFFVAFPLILTFTEILPKSLGLRFPEKMVTFGLPLVKIFAKLLLPFEKLGTALKVGDLESESRDVKEELLFILNEMRRSGEISEMEFELAKDIVELREVKVYEVMVPRTKIIELPAELDFEAVRKYVKEIEETRIPIYKGRRDEVIGILYVKDLVSFMNEGNDFEWHKLLREPYYVPESKDILSLLKEFKNKKISIALVVDEFGGISGKVTTYDLLKGFFVSAKLEEPPIREIEQGRYVVDGNMPFDEFLEEIKAEIEIEEFYTTVSSFLIDRIGRLPRQGDEVRCDTVLFRVKEVEGMAIKEIEVEKLQ